MRSPDLRWDGGTTETEEGTRLWASRIRNECNWVQAFAVDREFQETSVFRISLKLVLVVRRANGNLVRADGYLSWPRWMPPTLITVENSLSEGSEWNLREEGRIPKGGFR